MNFPRVRVSVLICNKGEVLLGRPTQSVLDRNGQAMSRLGQVWGTPGGKLELGESFEACAQREVAEETGLSIKNIRFCGATNTVYDPQTHWINIFVCADIEAGEIQNLEPDKCVEWRWFAWEQLPDNLFPPIKILKAQGIRL